MAEFTLEEAYAPPKVQPKPAVNPALVKALVPSTSMGLSPQDQRAFDLSEAQKKSAEQIRIREEKRAESRKIEEEKRAATRKLEEEKLKEANPMGSITEGERKASTLLTRMQSSSKQLEDVLKQYPNAAKPEYLSSLVQGISEPAANIIRSTPRQQIETAQKDIVDAYLTASTGATYTPIQFKEFKEFLFPQIGDDLPTLKDKENRLKTAIEAVRLQAGRAAKLVPEVKSGNQPPAGAPPDAKKAPDGKWYSPDPKRAGKYLQWGD
jgi:hypothetical protein